MKELEVYKSIVDIIAYSNKFILSSFPKTEPALKIKFTDSLYSLLENVIRVNVNTGSIRLKFQRELLVTAHFLDYYIEEIKKHDIITNKRYIAFVSKLNGINKLVNGWIRSEKTC